MTRYRKRKLRTIVNFCVLVMVPVAAAGAARVIPEAGMAMRELGSIRLDKESPEYDTVEAKLTHGSAVSQVSGDMVISQGYGWREEKETLPTGEVVLPEPMEMVSDSPGEKPYPVQWGEGGAVVRTTYGEYSGDSFFDLDSCGQVNNKTEHSNAELLEESRELPAFTISDTTEPQVLIYHTHTTESFEPFVRESCDDTFNYRTTDDTKNVVMVGDAIQAELEAAGIGVIHARTIHDYPSYNGSYSRSRETIVPILEEYPTIKVALDIHRDAVSGEGFITQPYAEIGGKEAAQVMIISGCDDGTLGMPEYMKNFHFACALQQQLEGDWKGLTRPILFDYRHYNQDLTTGSLLIEVGSHGNTLSQVQWSGQLIGRSLGKLLNGMKEN
ncbi:MAG TPA: stage II sporulation protein P [Ruminococcus sp.]|nr:stage II sporulation protein P [Ruminococcus sp.]